MGREISTQNDGIWGTFGVHPHYAKDFTEKLDKNMRNCLKHKKAVGVGECGLDYSIRCASNTDIQKEVFLKQIRVAKEVHNPLLIHSREAEDDVYDLLI